MGSAPIGHDGSVSSVEPEPAPDTIEDGELAPMSYAEFGARFFATAVTRERIAEAAQGLAGRPIDVGPLGVGPLGLVKVRANGAVGTPEIVDRDGELVAFDVAVPVDLDMVIEIGLEKYRFTAAMTLHLVVTARAAEPLLIVIDVEPPTRRTIDVDLHADGLRASVVQLVAGVEGELKRSVAKFVRAELDKPAAREARIIDVATALANLSLGANGGEHSG